MPRNEELPNSPDQQQYSRSCSRTRRGISVGWADIYHAILSNQTIDLRPTSLPDGECVLRDVVDPFELLVEGPMQAQAEGANSGDHLSAAEVTFTIQIDQPSVPGGLNQAPVTSKPTWTEC